MKMKAAIYISDYLETHEDSVHEGKKISMWYMWQTVYTNGWSKKTYDSVLEGNKYICDVCTKQFIQRDYLRTHKDSVHEANISMWYT